MEEEKYIPIEDTVTDTVIIPREEYSYLIRAMMGIETIAASETKYGFDSAVIHAVLKIFGYTPKEEEDA